MEGQAQMVAPHGHEADPQQTGLRAAATEGEEKRHDEKPMMQKMKDKVKKIKDKMGGKKHDDGHDQTTTESEEEEEEEEGYKEDDEESDPQVHGAPKYETLPVKKPESGKISLEESTGPMEEDPAAPYSSKPPAREGEEIGVSPVIKAFESMDVSGQPKSEQPKPKSMDVSDQPKSEQPKPKSMDVSDQTKSKQPKPEFMEVSDQTKSEQPKPESMDVSEQPKSEKPKPESMDVSEQPKSEQPKPESESTDQQNKTYTEKIKSMANVPAGYGMQMASTIYSKISGYMPESPMKKEKVGKSGEGNQDKGVSVKEYLSEKLKPGEEDEALSEVISESMQRRQEEMGKKAGGNVTAAGAQAKDGGVGAVEKIREAVTSVVGGGKKSDVNLSKDASKVEVIQDEQPELKKQE